MAQLKSGSTVGGQSIASTAQTGIPTGINDLGWTRLGVYRTNQNYSSAWQTAYHATFPGSQLGAQNSTIIGTSIYLNYGSQENITSVQGSSQVFGVGTWRALGTMKRTFSFGQDGPSQSSWTGTILRRIT